MSATMGITPGTAATITATGERVIVSYITVELATVIVQPQVIARPYKGATRAGLTTTGGKMRTVQISELTAIADGWQLFEPAGCIGSE